MNQQTSRVVQVNDHGLGDYRARVVVRWARNPDARSSGSQARELLGEPARLEESSWATMQPTEALARGVAAAAQDLLLDFAGDRLALARLPMLHLVLPLRLGRGVLR